MVEIGLVVNAGETAGQFVFVYLHIQQRRSIGYRAQCDGSFRGLQKTAIFTMPLKLESWEKKTKKKTTYYSKRLNKKTNFFFKKKTNSILFQQPSAASSDKTTEGATEIKRLKGHCNGFWGRSHIHRMSRGSPVVVTAISQNRVDHMGPEQR